ncbi:transcriptional regulator, LysR family [Rhizobiales bacterium GAS113]|nr:transcriptional regulator, LysR family [Rhizobiales bacterium GAS113]
MSTEDPGWELYRSFLTVLREGSLSGAARALALTQPTIGRHVAALEASLGIALFTRSPQGLEPTEAANELRSLAETMAASAQALLRAASGRGQEMRGTVRLTASEVVGAEVVPPILAELRETHPELVIELVLSNRNDDLLRGDADIAIRMVRPTQGALLARHVGAVLLGFHAHRRYLDRHGSPANLDELASHALIGFDQESGPARILIERGLPVRRELFALRTDSDLAQLAAIRAGVGIGICQVGIARRNPDLCHLLPAAFSHGLDTWIVMHEDLRANRRCRAVFDTMVAGLTAYIATATV